jgi:3-oxoisoapionate decarboxylase
MTRAIEMHVHSFGLRFHLRYGAMTVFDYIDHARSSGFTGVNISANGPGFRDLGGTTTSHLRAVRRHLGGMPCEIDTSDTNPFHMERMLQVATTVGADTLRTYTRHSGDHAGVLERTIADLTSVAPLAASAGVLVVLENHEDFTGPAVAEIVSTVNHPWVRALYDYGNSQMVGEDPFDALEAMAPHTARVHAKDHAVLIDGDGTWIQGVEMGAGSLPIVELTERLYDAGVRRFCFENVWSYVARLRATGVPATSSFEVRPGTRRLDGTTLPRADAQLSDAGFRIEPGTPPPRRA